MWWIKFWLDIYAAAWRRPTLEVVKREENVIYVRGTPHRCSA